MIDPTTEDLMTLARAAKEPQFRRDGKTPHLSTVWRYAQCGAGRNKTRLETIRTPSGMKTSREAIGRFIAALNDPGAVPVTSSPRRQAATAAADRELDAAGIR